jgi:hypothetical protein
MSVTLQYTDPCPSQIEDREWGMAEDDLTSDRVSMLGLHDKVDSMTVIDMLFAAAGARWATGARSDVYGRWLECSTTA